MQFWLFQALPISKREWKLSRWGEEQTRKISSFSLLLSYFFIPNEKYIISKIEKSRKMGRWKFNFTMRNKILVYVIVYRMPFQTSQPVNSENDERRGAVNWQCLDSGAKSNPKIRPNIRRGIFPVSCKPLSTIFTSATQHFTPSPLLTAPIFYILALFCISLA